MSTTITTAETFDATQEDFWICVCGNDPCGSGLYPCTATGELVDPTPESGWSEQGEHYRCADCGRFGSQKENADGRVRVAGRVDLDSIRRVSKWLTDWAKKDRDSKTQDWPGIPETQVPLSAMSVVRELIAEEVLQRVERPSKVDPTAVRRYFVLVER